MKINRLFDFLTMQVQANPDDIFLSSKVASTISPGTWHDYSYQDTQHIVDRVSQLLIDAGLKKGDKIALISNNRPEWNFADLGSQQIGVINVPMYPTISEDDYAFIFQDAGIQFAFVGDTDILAKVQPLEGRISTLKKILTFDDIAGADNFRESIDQIKTIDYQEIDKRKEAVDKADIVTIIYTSGTTGLPKGVMLTHLNIVSNLTSVSQVLPFMKNQKSLSFLPLCHSFERTVFYAYLMFGIHIYYAESLDTIGENLREVQPYCFTTVPRVLEKVYEKIMAKGNNLTGIRRSLFFWSIQVGAAYKLGLPKSLSYRLQLAIARKLVFSKWQEALGGKVEFIVTGAAAMQPRLITLFTAAGIQVIEGYGLTETSPVLTVNGIEEDKRCVGSIGMPIPGVEIRLAEDGEIVARGPNIMKGYYNRPDLTEQVIDKDGWFYTGDIGSWFDYNGYTFLKITDRKKELFKTAGGKYIAPQAIENKMKESRYIEQIIVVGGDTRKYIGALIVPSFPQLEAWVKENNISAGNHTELVNNPQIISMVENEITRYNRHFGKWEQIKKIKLLDKEWTIGGGQLTPTLKLKRKIIEEQFATEINTLFKD